MHLGELFRAKALVGQALEQFAARVWLAPDGAEFRFIPHKLWQFAVKQLNELLRAHRLAIGMPEAGDQDVLDRSLLAIAQLDLHLGCSRLRLGPGLWWIHLLAFTRFGGRCASPRPFRRHWPPFALLNTYVVFDTLTTMAAGITLVVMRQR